MGRIFLEQKSGLIECKQKSNFALLIDDIFFFLN